ncbi:MAG: TIGR02281 family clan AA aspartic protease [Betaproteobacteria bacterium]|nr:MAG: TIGR02281 family clan AA aspartic protease [Betaproteobacteria bacterium]
MKRIAAWLLAALAFPALATNVMVMSLTGSRVELLIDNRAVRTLRTGESSPEGVRLVEIRDGAALLEFDGRRWQMRLGSSTAPSVVLQADERGHFIVNADVNGAPLRALIDTGATAVAINLADAQRAGVNFAGARRVWVQTAGGPRSALVARLAYVRVGDLLVRDVEATVSEANELPIALLGMSFLNQVELQRSGRTLTLTGRH